MAYSSNILLGRITKTSGYEGALTLKIEKEFIENIPHLESVFIEIDGRPVPFFISGSDYSGNDILKLKFTDYDTADRVSGFIGCGVYLTSGSSINEEADDYSELKGYKVQNEDGHIAGEIEEVIKYPGQLLIKIITPLKKEILIPLHEDLIMKIDSREEVILMKIPEGLTEIN